MSGNIYFDPEQVHEQDQKDKWMCRWLKEGRPQPFVEWLNTQATVQEMEAYWAEDSTAATSSIEPPPKRTCSVKVSELSEHNRVKFLVRNFTVDELLQAVRIKQTGFDVGQR